MFREMRRKDRELKHEETIDILKNHSYGILSTADGNGFPYGVPMSYVLLNSSIYFHCADQGHKLDNIWQNSKVSFCVVGNTRVLPGEFSTRYESAVLFGKAVEVFEDEKYTALMEILKKYSPDHTVKGKEYIDKKGMAVRVIKINIEHISGKARR